MNNDVAIFLDLDNLAIGAAEANLPFDVQLILRAVSELTNGRLVLRRAYGDWRQRQNTPKELAAAGFELQATVRLSNVSKNLADMQLVVDAMETLIDGHNFTTYVLATGDRDFVPLVQALRKRGKQVIGIGIRHTSSKSLASLCDHYVFYEELAESALEMDEQEVVELLRRAAEQMLQDADRVPASMLKQRLNALSNGVFNNSKQGKRNFRKLLDEHPEIVIAIQDGTTLYAARPTGRAAPAQRPAEGNRALAPAEIESLLRQALERLLADQPRARASLLKQELQELSHGAFSETSQGDRSFRQFLDRYPGLVRVEQEATTLYVTWPIDKGSEPKPAAGPMANDEIERLLAQAMDYLLADQPRARASLLKQRMQELSHGAFNETIQGYASFRHFLEQYPALVSLQQTASTVFVARPEKQDEEEELHVRYRAALKKRGLRVVPPAIRLKVLKDVIAFLQLGKDVQWKQLIDGLVQYYRSKSEAPVSKGHINDVMRIARRADVIGVVNGRSLALASVKLQLEGSKTFQDAVMRCDATYLSEIMALSDPFDLAEAALALYDTPDYARYLKVLLNRFAANGRPPTTL
jgi:uncharacterized LabA/DUF88 family protein